LLLLLGCLYLIEDLQEETLAAHNRMADNLQQMREGKWNQLKSQDDAERYLSPHVARSMTRCG
jgi:hypothetical protein